MCRGLGASKESGRGGMVMDGSTWLINGQDILMLRRYCKGKKDGSADKESPEGCKHEVAQKATYSGRAVILFMKQIHEENNRRHGSRMLITG